MTEAGRLLVVGRPFDLSDAQFDGFVIRHRAAIERLATGHELNFLLLRPTTDRTEVSTQYASQVVADVALPPAAGTRAQRARQVTRDVIQRSERPWEVALARAAQAVRPDAVVTLGPWLNYEYRALFARFATLHLYEEDLSRMIDLAPQSRRAQLFRRVEMLARRSRAAQPKVVVVIGEAEVKPARGHFPGSDVQFIPYTLPSQEWPLADSTSSGDNLLVVGALTNARHAEGLGDVLYELSERHRPDIKVQLVSGGGLHDDLEPHRRHPWVEHLSSVEDVRPLYRHARLALVPAKRATGIKTTILQAWATGCPVIAFTGSAATVGSRFSGALRSANDPHGVVDHIIALWDDQVGRDDLAREGLRIMSHHFDDQMHMARLTSLVDGLADSTRS